MIYLYTIKGKKSIRSAYSYTKILPEETLYRIVKVYMTIKQTVKLFFVGLLLTMGLLYFTTPTANAAECGGVPTSIIDCPDQDGKGLCPDGNMVDSSEKCADGSVPKTDIENTGAWGILLLVVNILTAGVGVLALGGIVYGAILYISAGGSPEQVKKAMGIFMNIVIGVVAYAGMYALLNFLVPGGIFN